MKITPEIFEQQCKHRFGIANPERMQKEHWEWMVRRGDSAYSAKKDIGLENVFTSGPDWCFERFGMSRTQMPDGRIICIAGEHEDFYDPDFCIYNDVIVLRPAAGTDAITVDSGEVEIYGYPFETFVPTDFHSATLVDTKIFLIGRLGYNGAQIEGRTPVYSLDTETYEIKEVPTSGSPPGWIYEHHASYDAGRHAITVRGGKIYVKDATSSTVNMAAHQLHLADLRWEVIAKREIHTRYVIETNDSLGMEFDHRPEMFRPKKVPYGWLNPEERGVLVCSLDIQGVRVTFQCYYSYVRVLMEGNLQGELVRSLLNDIAENLSEKSGVEWHWREGDWAEDAEVR